MKHLLVTGTPGCGKTTLIKEASEFALELGLKVRGFYTAEIRHGGRRSGFKIITLPDRKEGILASVGKRKGQFQKYGRYKVFVEEFEGLVLPILKAKNVDLLVVDEIGGMELLSKPFGMEIKRALAALKPLILGTIQSKRVHLIYKWGVADKVKMLELHELTRKRVRQEVREWITEIHGRKAGRKGF